MGIDEFKKQKKTNGSGAPGSLLNKGGGSLQLNKNALYWCDPACDPSAQVITGGRRRALKTAPFTPERPQKASFMQHLHSNVIRGG